MILAAAWVMENSAIRFYGIYEYHDIWTLKLDRVPLLVVFTWPIIICMAHEMVTQAYGSTRFVPLLSALVVLTDALFIEPIAVRTGLWSWRQAGIFDVPLAGIAGWFFFALACLLILYNRAGKNTLVSVLLEMVVIVVATHCLLVASWWLIFKWVGFQFDSWWVALAAGSISLLVSLYFKIKKTGGSIEPVTLLLRMPAAGFFWFQLIDRHCEPYILTVYIAAFTLPYMILFFHSLSTRIFAIRSVAR